MSEIFRDRTEGANARRLDLLRRRRDELITMPHAVRRVFVARSSRIAASVVACIGGAILLATATVPPVTALFEKVLPGGDPAALSQLLISTVVATVVMYAMSRSRAEHRFVVAMSRYVLPGDDVDYDIERLSHEHPDAMAKAMAQRLEVRSAALPTIAAAFILPGVALYLIDAAMARGWPLHFEEHIGVKGYWLAGIGIAGLALGLIMTRRFARVPLAGKLAALVAVGTAIAAAVVAVPTGVVQIWLLAPMLLATTIALLVRRLRIERDQIDAIDPAAGSELFSWRDAVAMARTFVRDRRVKRAFWVVAATTPLVVAIATSKEAPARATTQAQPAQVVVQPAAAPAEPQNIPIDVVDNTAIVYGIGDLKDVPKGWKLHVRPKLNSGVTKVTPTEIAACETSMPVQLVVSTNDVGTKSMDLALEATLIYAPCN